MRPNTTQDGHADTSTTALRTKSATTALSLRISESRMRTRNYRPTSYVESLIHLLKGNIGAGVFAMGFAFKNAGLLAATILTLLLGVVCLYCDHLLIGASLEMKYKLGLETSPNFAETVEYSFETGPYVFKKWTGFVRFTVKLFIVVTQLGFCTIYFVLVSTTLKEVLAGYGIDLEAGVYMAIIYCPIILSCLIRTLKVLTPVSLVSNVLLFFAIVSTLYISCLDLPAFSTRKMLADIEQLPIYFGTTIFAFEGISLILPLLSEMNRQELFDSPLGVLNVGIVTVTLLYTAVGFIGYLKYGEAVHGTITLDLAHGIMANIIQLALSLGIIFTYPLQFYVANDVIWGEIDIRYGPVGHPVLYETLVRIGLVTLTFLLAVLIPKLGLFISLIGAVSSTVLALVYPPSATLPYAAVPPEDFPLKTKFIWLRLTMDAVILVVAVIGFATGTYCSIKAIVDAFSMHGFRAEG